MQRGRIRDIKIIWKNDWLRNGTTSTGLPLTQQSASGNSDYMENGGHFEHQIQTFCLIRLENYVVWSNF